MSGTLDKEKNLEMSQVFSIIKEKVARRALNKGHHNLSSTLVAP